MKSIDNYALQITTHLSFDAAIAKVTELLKEEGFGILTEIDVKETLKNKLDVDFKPFRILGACNPKSAHAAMSAVPEISVLLPCNVVVWDEGSHRVVSMMDPLVMSRIIVNETIQTIAGEISNRLRNVLGKLEAVSAND